MKIGIIGTGRIANRFVPENAEVEKFYVQSVYNPRLSSAVAFADTWSIPCSTDIWEKFCEDIEAAYVASPHETHYEYVKKLLLAGKHVLCEKPLCLIKSQAEELFTLATQKKLVLMEAVKTAYCPGFMELLRIAQSGIIGDIKDVEACFTKLTDPTGRELSSEECAGSFYEMGTYTLLPAIKLLGRPKDVFFQKISGGPRGADGFAKAHLLYDDAFALAKTGLTVKSEGCLIVSGTKGYILAESPWWLTRKFEVRFEDPAATQVYAFPFEGQGLRYEIHAFWEQIEAEKRGEIRQQALVAEESLWMVEILDKLYK